MLHTFINFRVSIHLPFQNHPFVILHLTFMIFVLFNNTRINYNFFFLNCFPLDWNIIWYNKLGTGRLLIIELPRHDDALTMHSASC